jgi:hypothetical protein
MAELSRADTAVTVLPILYLAFGRKGLLSLLYNIILFISLDNLPSFSITLFIFLAD